MPDWLAAIILGLVEGATEFIPVSSTGHLLLAQQVLHRNGPFWDAFAVMIQLGAILSVVVLYFQRLIGEVIRLPTDPAARRFALSVIVARAPEPDRSLLRQVGDRPQLLVCGSESANSISLGATAGPRRLRA